MLCYFFLGSSPADEPCAQVGSVNYDSRARRECITYRDQLIREFGIPPGNSNLITKRQDHDFGGYFEVAICFNDENKEEIDYAYRVEGTGFPNWDEEARKELGLT